MTDFAERVAEIAKQIGIDYNFSVWIKDHEHYTEVQFETICGLTRNLSFGHMLDLSKVKYCLEIAADKLEDKEADMLVTQWLEVTNENI